MIGVNSIVSVRLYAWGAPQTAVSHSCIEAVGVASRLRLTQWHALGQVHPYLDWGQLNWGRVIDREG